MKPAWQILFLCVGLAVSRAAAADDWIDQVEESLRFSSAGGNVRAKLSGTLDLEGYAASVPVADLLYSDQKLLFNPRLSLFLDAQVGSRAYFFAQLRVDRGFDPSDGSTEVRLDEYALRLELWKPGRLNVQVGKFATVVGNWVARHDSWNNPFITAPLPYDNLTGVWDYRAVPSVAMLLQWSHVQPASPGAEVYADKMFRLPVVWGPVYANGVALSGACGRLTYAAELKSSGLASRPTEWKEAGWDFYHPAFAARVGYRPNEMWDVGLSASQAEYLDPATEGYLPAGVKLSSYRERVVAQDLGFAWHHFQFWSEAYFARFEIPLVANLSTFAYYCEARYKFTPQFFGAVRWNQQLYGEVKDLSGQSVPWSREVWRVDVAPTYRFTAHTQLKLQYSLRHEDPSPEKFTHTFAAQFVFRF